MKTKHASTFSIIFSTLVELTLLTIGMCIGFSIPILFIFSVFYKFYSFNLSDAIFIIFGCIVYFLHLFRRMKNPQLFDMSKELKERSYQEISYFGMSFGFSAIVISFALSFIRFLGVKTINPDEKSIIFMIEKIIYDVPPKFLLPSIIFMLGFMVIFLGLVGIFIFLKNSNKGKNVVVILAIIFFYLILSAFILIYLDSNMNRLVENKILIEITRFIIGFPALGFFRMLFYGSKIKRYKR